MNKKLFFFCGVCTAAVIAMVYWVIPPVLTTQDDVFATYMLGNGFPQATIQVSYFECNFLFYEKIFVWLYHHFSGVNWLSAYYVLLHWLCGSTVCYTLLHYRKNIISLMALTAYLFLFFIPLIIKVSHTAVAGHCIATSLFVLFSFMVRNKVPGNAILVLLLLLAVAGVGLRAHMVLPLLVTASGGLLLVKQKAMLKRVAAFVLLLTGITVTCIALHHTYYENNIPNWKRIKVPLDAYFQIANTKYDEHKIAFVTNPALREKFLGIRNSFLIYDSTLMDPTLLQQFIAATKQENNFTQENFEALLWMANDAKQPLFYTLAAMVLLALYGNNQRLKYAAFVVFMIMGAINCYLVFYMKNAERIWMPLLLLSFLATYYSLLAGTGPATGRAIKKILSVLLVLLVCLQCFSLVYLRWRTMHYTKMFTCSFELFKQNSQVLFLESGGRYSGNGLDFGNMPLFALPKNYPATNVCSAFFFNFGLTEKTIHRFGFNAIDEVFYSDKVLFLGRPDSTFVDYIYHTKHLKLQFVKADSIHSPCIDLYKAQIIK